MGDKGLRLRRARTGPGRYYGVGAHQLQHQRTPPGRHRPGGRVRWGCWLARGAGAGETSTSTASGRLMLQMEFVGFARLASAPANPDAEISPATRICQGFWRPYQPIWQPRLNEHEHETVGLGPQVLTAPSRCRRWRKATRPQTTSWPGQIPTPSPTATSLLPWRASHGTPRPSARACRRKTNCGRRALERLD